METDEIAAASAAFRRGAFDECVTISNRAIESPEMRGNPPAFWWFRCIMAQCLGMQGRFAEALDLVEVNKLTTGLESALLGQLLIQKSFYLSRIGNYLQARDVLQEAADLADETGQLSLRCEVEINQMTLAFYMADHEGMERRARSALSLSLQHGLPLVEARACSGIGKSFMLKGEFAEAITWYERSRGRFVDAGLSFEADGILSELGCCYYGLKEDDRALQYYEQALQSSLEARAMPTYQIDLANIGNIYLRRGEFSAAILNYQKAVEIARELGDWISVAKWLGNLAHAYSVMGNALLAENFELQAEQAQRKVAQARAAAAI